MGQAGHRRYVERNQPGELFAALAEKVAGNGGAGIVNQNADARIFPQTLLDGGNVVIVSQIGG